MPISAAATATYAEITRVNSIIAVESQPLQTIRTQKADVDAAKTSISTLATKLSSLSGAADALSEPGALFSQTASSSDSAVVASVGSNGTPASAFTVSVDKIATEQRTVSYAKSTESDPLNMSGKLELRVGSTTSTLSIEATDSLQDIAKKINDSGQRVSASVTYDADGFKLAVRGLDTGSANGFSFNQVGEGPSKGTNSVNQLGLWRPSNTTQVAQNAEFTVNGVAGTSDTNQVKNVVDGVTLALTRPTTSEATVTVVSEAVAQTKLTSFVNAFNDVMSAGDSSTTRDDAAVKATVDRVTELLEKPIANSSGGYTTLRSVGLESDASGTLRLDSAKLAAALASDPEGVSRVFASSDYSGGAMATFRAGIDELAGSSASFVQSQLAGLIDESKLLAQGEGVINDRIATHQSTLHDLFVTLASQLNPPTP